MSMFERIKKWRILWPLVVFISILLFNLIISRGEFLKLTIVDGHLFGRLIDILRNGSKLILLAIGMTFVIASGGIDISVGSIMAISGAIACSIVGEKIFPIFGGNVYIAVLLAIIACTIAGCWSGFLVSRVNIQPMVATLILMVAGRGIAQLITKGRIVTIASEEYYYISGGYIFGLPVSIYLALIVLLCAWLFTEKTSFGLFLKSLGMNAASSRLAGINVKRIKLLVYAFSGTTAAIAGLIESAGIRGADSNNAGLMIELDAILAVAISGNLLTGGSFSIGASVIGALIIQSITTTIYALKIPPEIIQLAKAILVVIICFIQSPGFNEMLKRKIASLRSKKRA